MQPFIQFAYSLRRSVLGLLRIRTTGVKVMLFNPAGELLLIRNGYGDTSQYLLPGGGVSRGEGPAAAAIREVREELGIDIHAADPVWTYESEGEGKRDTIHLFRAEADEEPKADNLEVVEARFFALDALPRTVSPATTRRIEELRGERPYDGRW